MKLLPLRSWRRAAGATALAVSLAANVGLGLACFEFYRRELRVRLDPTHPVPPGGSPRDGRGAVVLFLGDSRMQEWPPLPKDRFVTINAGGGGETRAQIRLRAEATLQSTEPAFVVLQAGINDLKMIGALPEQASTIEARCGENLSALVELSRRHGARVVLVPILPAASPSLARRLVWSPEIELARRRVNERLRRRFGAMPGVALLGEALLVPDTAVDYRDTLHFRPRAYAKLEASTLKAIESL